MLDVVVTVVIAALNVVQGVLLLGMRGPSHGRITCGKFGDIVTVGGKVDALR
ncbi:MAG TPA: hypothetical protein VN650_07705 [Gemmatimonadaceae bacterium]|nr:hypothetical protein [Gemmatimonadaceae bacterium]